MKLAWAIVTSLALFFSSTACGEGYASSRPQVSNPRWVCTNCADDANAKMVFGLARHAMQSEAREVFLAFDHSWLDRALQVSARVVVTLIPRAELAAHLYDVAATKVRTPCAWLKGDLTLSLNRPPGHVPARSPALYVH